MWMYIHIKLDKIRNDYIQQRMQVAHIDDKWEVAGNVLAKSHKNLQKTGT